MECFKPGRVLENDWVKLEPMEIAELEAICAALLPDPSGWYQRMFGLTTMDLIRDEIVKAQTEFAAGTSVGYVIRDLTNGKVAGITKFMKLDAENRHLEIGNTMIGPAFRGTFINSNAKYLMLLEAFELLQCVRVSFRVDKENKISQRAIERLGAVCTGVLRHERVLPNGDKRDYLFYSILDSEWPLAKTRIQESLVPRMASRNLV